MSTHQQRRLVLGLCLLSLLGVLQPIEAGKNYASNKYSAEANGPRGKDGGNGGGGKSREYNGNERRGARSEESVESAESNELPSAEKYDADFRKLHKPFRMSKLNLVWSKAQQRLTEPKLKSLFTDLKIHDKEELAWKQLNGQSKDKDGLKEAALRQKLVTIMSTYDILEHFDDTQDASKHKHNKDYAGRVTKDGEVGDYHRKDSHKNRGLFKDKKLNKLWEKAEVAGFTADELAALRDEFGHHQDKVDMYYAILEDSVLRRKDERHENAVNEDEFDQINQIQHAEEKQQAAASAPESADIAAAQKHSAYVHEANLLRDKHRDLRDNLDRLERIAARGPNSDEFVEPKVQNLWRVASAGNFSADELASLRVELLHFESRLLKLRHLHAEQALNAERHKEVAAQQGGKYDKYASLDEHIKKQLRKVEKMQVQLEERIFMHTEL